MITSAREFFKRPMNRSITFRRYISISKSAQPIRSANVTVTESENISNVKKLIQNEASTPVLLPIDSSLVAIDMPASVPISIRRGSLMLIYGISNVTKSAISNQLSFTNWSIFQRITATQKISLLVSSTRNKSLSIVSLDGTTDWAILKPSSLFFHIGNSLTFLNKLLPSKVTKSLVRKRQLSSRPDVGLRSLTHWYYTIVSGRGQIGLSGNGSIYNVDLVEGEEVLVNKKNLLAVTVNGPSDLANCIYKFEIAEDQSSKPEVIKENKGWRDYLHQALQWAGLWSKKGQNYLIGNNEFVRVLGPRNLLMTSDAKYKLPTNLDVSGPLKTFEKKSSDFLNYVRLDKGIESTKNFSESLESKK